jgi:hypothetical protein
LLYPDGLISSVMGRLDGVRLRRTYASLRARHRLLRAHGSDPKWG